MQRQFFAAVERDHHRNGQQAARVTRQAFTRPDFAPRITCDQVLEFFGQISAIRKRPVDVRVAEHRATYAHPSFVAVFVVHFFSVRKSSTAFVKASAFSMLEICEASSST